MHVTHTRSRSWCPPANDTKEAVVLREAAIAFAACSHAAEALRDRPCGCGVAAKSVRAVIARWREQVKP